MKYEAVIWWATPVEIASALARLVRMKQLDPLDWSKSRGEAADLADEWSVIEPSDALRARASQLVVRYHLRAGDALQLSAALEWCKGVPVGEVFLAADEKLTEAAVLSGFDGQLI
jgi:predicted nucleic acid-binding protein